MKRKNLKTIRSLQKSAQIRQFWRIVDAEADRLIEDWQRKSCPQFWVINSDCPPDLGELMVNRIIEKMEHRGLRVPAIVLSSDVA